MALGPDEQIYLAQAMTVRAGSLRGLRDIADEYLDEPSLSAYPSPLRWLWASLVAITLPLGETALQLASAALIGPVVWLATGSLVAALWGAASPLVLTLCRRRLQDVPVALASLGAIAAALHHHPAATACALALALCLKESSVLLAPALAAAWLVSGGEPAPLVLALATGAATWIALLTAIFGARWVAMLRVASSGHNTPYAAEHQKGAPHRLLVDLALTSPVALVFGAMGAVHQPALAAAAAAILVAHACGPIRNVRLVLAADVLIRAVGASAMAYPAIELLAALLVDAAIAWRIRSVYDPVTRALVDALVAPSPAVDKR